MEFNLSTFVLELLNFLVLVWILKRFLYRPVLEVIAKRRAEIDKTMADAKRIESEAKAMQERYEQRNTEWETERAKARQVLNQEIDEERSRHLEELRKSLASEREKSLAAERQRLTDLEAQCEQKALRLASRFASRLLSEAATKELQTKLVDEFLEELELMTPERIAHLLGNPELPPDSIRIESAYPLDQSSSDGLSRKLLELTGLDVPVRFQDDPSLMAGIRVSIGACILGLNLQDELEGFASVSRAEA